MPRFDENFLHISKAVLDGDIVSIGGRYILTTRLMSSNGEQLATFSEEASSENELIPAIGRLGKQVRTKAGESLKTVREAGALDRVTTSSLEALRKYVAGNVVFDQTFDYTQAIPLFKEAVTIDSTFAMGWRRLASYYNNTFRFEDARAAANQAFKYADRLSDVERQLTYASYYTYGAEVDEEKALAAYESVLAHDSLNAIALNNAAQQLESKGQEEKAFEYYARAARQPGGSAIQLGNAVNAAVRLGRFDVADSINREFVRRFPNNPVALRAPAVIAIAQGDYERGEQLAKEIEPRITGSRTGMIQQRNLLGNVALTRGRVRESLRFKAEARERQAQTGAPALAHLNAGLDSVLTQAVVLEDQAGARAMLERTLRRAPIDSVPVLDRDYSYYLFVAAMVKDTTRARAWHADSRRLWEQAGKLTVRPSYEALDDANLALARGQLPEALGAVERAYAHPNDRPDGLAAELFTVLSRMQQPDSAIAVGEKYLGINIVFRHQYDGFTLAGVRQRLGELYEAKGNVDKALEHYTAFVELWKDADPELQPRVAEVRRRISRLSDTERR